MGDLDAKLGLGKPCFYGIYNQITSSTKYDDSQLTQNISDVINSGAIMIASIMPTGLKYNQVTPDMANQIATQLTNITSQGVPGVYIRLAHEFNVNASPIQAIYETG